MYKVSVPHSRRQRTSSLASDAAEGIGAGGHSSELTVDSRSIEIPLKVSRGCSALVRRQYPRKVDRCGVRQRLGTTVANDCKAHPCHLAMQRAVHAGGVTLCQ